MHSRNLYKYNVSYARVICSVILASLFNDFCPIKIKCVLK